jgi:hypothetical protein
MKKTLILLLFSQLSTSAIVKKFRHLHLLHQIIKLKRLSKPVEDNESKIIEPYESLRNSNNLDLCKIEIFKIESKYLHKNLNIIIKTIENKLNNIE